MTRPMVRSDARFGALMVNAKFINLTELEDALRRHTEEGGHRKLGEILLEMGVCTEHEIRLAMEAQEHLRNGGVDLTEMLEKASSTASAREEVEEIAVISGNLAKKMRR